MDQTLTCCNTEAFDLQKDIVKNLDEKDVDMYLFFTDTTTYRYDENGRVTGWINGRAAGIGTACDNIWHRKYSLTYGPQRGLMQSVEVSINVHYNICYIRVFKILLYNCLSN